jgi:hypothetical protein
MAKSWSRTGGGLILRTYVWKVPEEGSDVVEGGLDVFGTLVVSLLRHSLLVDRHAEPRQRIVEEQRKQITCPPHWLSRGHSNSNANASRITAAAAGGDTLAL